MKLIIHNHGHGLDVEVVSSDVDLLGHYGLDSDPADIAKLNKFIHFEPERSEFVDVEVLSGLIDADAHVTVLSGAASYRTHNAGFVAIGKAAVKEVVEAGGLGFADASDIADAVADAMHANGQLNEEGDNE